MSEKNASLQSLKDRVDKLRELRDSVKQKNQLAGKGAASSSYGRTPGVSNTKDASAYSAPTSLPKVETVRGASSIKDAVKSVSSRAFPFQRIAGKFSSLGRIISTLLLIFALGGIALLFVEEQMVDWDILSGLISSGNKDSAPILDAYVDTQLAAFQAGQEENPLGGDEIPSNETSVEEQVQEEADEQQLGGPMEESLGSPEDTQEIAEIAEVAAAEEPASVPDMKGRNTCMGAKLPWDPFLFGQPAGATEAAASARHLLFKGERPMVDNNPNSTKGWFNEDIYFICKKAKEKRKKKTKMTPALAALRDCLIATTIDGGSCKGMQDLETVRKAAAELPGMQRLMKPPRCMTVSTRGACTKWSGNKETEFQTIRSNHEVPPLTMSPSKDLKAKQWKTCALVGRSPIVKLSETGAVVDQHDAVWRFNLDTPNGYEKWVGDKTTVRVLNNGASHKAFDIAFKEKGPKSWHPGEHERWMKDVVSPIQKAGGKGKAETQEWVMWNVRSNRFIPQMSKIYRPHTQRMLAPDFVTWMLEVYFDIMADLEAIGLPPFDCEVNSLPSGTHAVFMAAMACDTVNVFGMSYTGSAVFARSAHVQYKWAPYEHHNWEFDGTLLRLLHLAGRLSICTRDDQSVSTKQMLAA